RGEKRRGFTVADFQRLQHDELSIQARALVPELLAAARTAGRSDRWEYRTLSAWDDVMRESQAAPLLFEVWKRALSTQALRALVGPETAGLADGNAWLDEWEAPDSVLAQIPSADRVTLLVTAMDSALVRIEALVGNDRSTWRWGAVHKATFNHRVA